MGEWHAFLFAIMSVTLRDHLVFTPASLVPGFSTCFPEIDPASEVRIIHTSPPLSHLLSQQTSQEPHPLIFGVRHDCMVPMVAGYKFGHHSSGMSLSSVFSRFLSTALLSSTAAPPEQCISLLACWNLVLPLTWSFLKKNCKIVLKL